MRKLEKVFFEVVQFLTGHDETKAKKQKSESFFGLLNTFIESFIKAMPTPPASEAGKNKAKSRRERKFGLGKKVVRREVMAGIKVGVTLKKTLGPQKSKSRSGSALADLMSKTMLARRKQVGVDVTTTAAGNFGDSDDDWSDEE